MKQIRKLSLVGLVIIFLVTLLVGCDTDNNQSSTIQKDVNSENNSTQIENSSVATEASESISNIESKLPLYKK